MEYDFLHFPHSFIVALLSPTPRITKSLPKFDRLFPGWAGPWAEAAAMEVSPSGDPIPYALETDWPVEAGGFEPLHFGIRSAAVDHGLRLSSGMRSGTTNFN